MEIGLAMLVESVLEGHVAVTTMSFQVPRHLDVKYTNDNTTPIKTSKKPARASAYHGNRLIPLWSGSPTEQDAQQERQDKVSGPENTFNKEDE